MSSRPPILLRPPHANLLVPWICRSCLSRTTFRTRRSSPPPLFFHSSATRLSDSAPDHYEALQLPSSASASDIKRQFYALSKKHHPDRNPNDPTASARFVAISEAYHVLSVPEKRARYDLQLNQQNAPRWRRSAGEHPNGSYSSASFAGSRPASGLNKKRSTFRGPPPSFYKSGGYGKHSAKRTDYAHHQHAHEKEGKDAGAESYGGFDGFGPGQTRQGSEVPHFDDIRHKEMHDHVNEHIHARRRRMRAAQVPDEIDRGGVLVNFILVAGAVGLIGFTAKLMGDSSESNRKRKGSL